MRRKVFFVLLILCFITAFAYSQKITITDPHSGSKWYKGKIYKITWTKSGQMNTKVKIRLFKGGSKVLDITNNTANSGSYTWKIPSTLVDGNNYIIRVKTLDNHVFDDSAIFTISKYSNKFDDINKYKGAIDNRKNINRNLIKKLEFKNKIYRIKPVKWENSRVKYYRSNNGWIKRGISSAEEISKGFYMVAGYKSNNVNLLFYRSKAVFDVNFLKGKGKLKKAILHFSTFNNVCYGITPKRKCDFSFFKLAANTSLSGLFGDVKLGGHRVYNNDISYIVNEWVKTGENYGLLFVGEANDPEGKLKAIGENQACLVQFRIDYLEVEME